MSKRTTFERLIGLVLRLYPSGFRRRHGAAAERLSAEVGTGASLGRKLFVLGDLVVTLPRAWLRALWLRVRDPVTRSTAHPIRSRIRACATMSASSDVSSRSRFRPLRVSR